MNWLKIKDTSLKSFPFPKNTRVTYKLTSEQFKELQDYLSIYGNNKVGRSQVIKIMNTKFLWRTPIIISTNNSQYVKENNSKSSFSGPTCPQVRIVSNSINSGSFFFLTFKIRVCVGKNFSRRKL